MFFFSFFCTREINLGSVWLQEEIMTRLGFSYQGYRIKRRPLLGFYMPIKGCSAQKWSQKHSVWKSQKKSHSTLRAKRATFTFWVDKSWLKMPNWSILAIFWKTSSATFLVIFKHCAKDAIIWALISPQILEEKFLEKIASTLLT